MKNLKDNIKSVVGRPAMRAYHAIRSSLTALAYGLPGQNMCAIGITGTNGKTTVAHLVTAIFEAAGRRVAMMSTVRLRIAGDESVNETKMTVPDPQTFNQFIVRARQNNCDVLVMEATSIALDQSRMFGIQFDTGVLTNITHDHLDYHGTFDSYVQAKRMLFASGLRVSVLNWDDPNGRSFAECPADVRIFYSLDENNVETLRPLKLSYDEGISFECHGPSLAESFLVRSKLTGAFNVSNLLAAIGVALGHGIAIEIIQAGIWQLTSVPGRMESIDMGQPFRVIIDYAHTPDAFEKLYAAVKPITRGNILSVFGATGDRDKTKRPILGQIAGRASRYCLVTNEDPWSESAMAIIDAVAEGVASVDGQQEGVTFWRVLDRREAMAKAFALARPGDTVLITGKGDETGMGVGDKVIPWSDRAVAEEELKKWIIDNP